MAKTTDGTQTQALKLANSIEPDGVTAQFKLNAAKFASLGDAQDFIQLQDKLIEVDISSALEHLTEDTFFEVSLPVTGMADFLSHEQTWQDMPQQFPTVVAMNGFGAQAGGGYAKPYFILLTDLIGNEYEVLVDGQGQIEVPEEGFGLFSVLSSMTFIYGHEQIISGQGLMDLSQQGVKAGMLYLLPPPGLEGGFEPTIRVSRLDDMLQRQIDFELKTPIEMHALESGLNPEVKLETLETPLGKQLHVEVEGIQPHAKKPFKLHVDVESQGNVFSLDNMEHGAQQSSFGWQQTEQGFEKLMGLSDYASFALVRHMFSEFDFTKSLLQGESWGLETTNGFNNFGLRTEAIGPYYDLLVDAVVQQKIPGDYVFSHVSDNLLSDIDLSYAELEGHDQAVVDQLSQMLHNYDFSGLQSLFKGQDNHVIDDFYLNVEGDLHSLPEAHASFATLDSQGLSGDFDLHIPDSEHLTFDNAMSESHGFASIDNFLDLPDSSDIYANSFSEPVALKPGHHPTTIHYDDIMDMQAQGDVIKGFDIHHDKIDLSGLLDKMPGASEANIQLHSAGEDIQISIQTEQGDALPVATLIGAVGTDLPDDLSSIIVGPDLS